MRVSRALRSFVVISVFGCGDPHVKLPDASAVGNNDANLVAMSLWVKADDDPSDGVTDSARVRTGACTTCPSLVAGKIDSAYHFVQHEVTFAQTPDLAPRAGFTLATWARVDNMDANSSTLICKLDRTSINLELSYCLAIIHTATMRANYYKTGVQGGVGGPAIMLGRWHHLAMTWDGSTLMGYVDGRQDFMRADATPQVYDASQPVVLGSDQLGLQASLNGALDDVRVYPYALPAAEIAALAAL